MTAYPDLWLARMRERLGDQYDAFRAALNTGAHAGLRVNPLRSPAGEEAVARYCAEPVPWYSEWGRYVRPGEKPGADIAHFAGAYYMQEPSAMAAVATLNPREGELVLDLCAAPGGKSGQIACQLGATGALVCNEPDPTRARMLAGNLERLGVACASVVSAQPEVLADRWADRFDAVLCDAPCSGEGMFRRDEGARAQWTPRSVEGCANRQRGILAQAARMVRPGGRLVYSTCTFAEEENEANVRALLRERPDFAPGDFTLPGVGKSVEGCLRLWPHRLDGEGHFVALLVRSGAAKAERSPKGGAQGKGGTRAKRQREQDGVESALGLLWETVLPSLPERLAGYRPEVFSDRLFLVPERMPETAGLYCLRRGLPVCKMGARHIEPDHSLAMALLPGEAAADYALRGDDIAKWLRGEAVSAEPPTGVRWVWTHANGLPLGWGKYSDGWVKNHLPKGIWRR